MSIWDIDKLSVAPEVFPSDVPIMKDKSWCYEGILKTEELREIDKSNDYVKSIMYKGVDYKGKETRVFAFIGLPKVEEGKKIPAMVLVHGGGGSAFEAWVRLWNARGYAAIAMDTCGALPIGDYDKWEKHEYSCNSSWGDFDNIDTDLKDQWSYQAVSSVILANSLLRSYDFIDKDNIGITGVSWGGYLTCISSSVDYRFKVAIPIYGCGNLGVSSVWVNTNFADIGEENTKKWLSYWDPSNFLSDTKVPIHWITGNKDIAYFMLALKKSYENVPKNAYLHIKEDLPHDHGVNGETQEETFAIANMYLKKGKPVAEVVDEKVCCGKFSFNINSDSKIVKSVFFYTKEEAPDLNSVWEKFDIDLNNLKVEIPKDAKMFFANVFTEDNLVSSSRIFTK